MFKQYRKNIGDMKLNLLEKMKNAVIENIREYSVQKGELCFIAQVTEDFKVLGPYEYD